MNCNLLKILALLLIIGPVWIAGPTAQPGHADASTAFSLLKTLEGTWKASATNGKQSTTKFTLSGNGTVLVEHYENPAIPGGGHMMSAYHLDGRDLLLTHYCIANNQPTLRAARFDAAAREVQFEFLRATNLPNQDAGHMRRAKYRMIDRDNFETEWEFFEKGARKFVEVESFTRVK